MKHATRRQIHAYGLAALLLLVVALGVALAMLGHSTMSGGPQWSAGALAGTAAAGFIVFFVTLIVGATATGEWFRSRGNRTPEPNAGLWFVEDEQAAYDAYAEAAAFWAQAVARESVYEIDDADVDRMVQARRHHRAARKALTRIGR